MLNPGGSCADHFQDSDKGPPHYTQGTLTKSILSDNILTLNIVKYKPVGDSDSTS